ncbi:hypothetical protein DWB77_05346 [Streptomyces hundungensis]|uniref:Uncharacterized protein n=1 Tax=Streptomyces hundungensis TaxID=1077946 RepID=A0A387HPV8_9ACTN|nr:hypothetical protein [Streptomyces hundungensis]AYG83150.1 hypothetical protein DWB77_05346 [Streptomyces hundungensis]
MKQWDYVVVVCEGRTGLIPRDLDSSVTSPGDDMKRVAFVPSARPGDLPDATIKTRELRRATPEEAAAVKALGLTRESQRSYLSPRS